MYLEILPRISIEGRSSQAGDLSYWHDPGLFTDYWITKSRSAVILESSVDTCGYYRVKVIPIRRGPPVADAVMMSNAVRIANAQSATPTISSFLIGPWTTHANMFFLSSHFCFCARGELISLFYWHLGRQYSHSRRRGLQRTGSFLRRIYSYCLLVLTESSLLLLLTPLPIRICEIICG